MKVIILASYGTRLGELQIKHKPMVKWGINNCAYYEYMLIMDILIFILL